MSTGLVVLLTFVLHPTQNSMIDSGSCYGLASHP
jgi:hypothetical protein